MAYFGVYHPPPPPPRRPAPGEPERHKWSTVKPRSTDTRLIQTHHYYGQFVLSLGKESPYISLNSILWIWTLSVVSSVSVLTRFDCIIHFKLCSGLVLFYTIQSVSYQQQLVSEWWPYLLLPGEQMGNTDFINAEIEYISERGNCLSSRVTKFQIVGKSHKALKLYEFV